MVAIYVGVTDGDWYSFLAWRPDITEVNFWQPVDTRRFGALRPGELFLFKLKAPNHFIAGGGLFVGANAYPTSLAWAAFGEGNGVASLDELRQRIGRLSRPFRNQPFDPTRDPPIGCRILEHPFFFAREQWIPVPASWSRNLVRGRTYDTATEDGRHLWEAVMERLERTAPEPIAQVARFGSPVLIEPRGFPCRGNGRLWSPLRTHGRAYSTDPRRRRYPCAQGRRRPRSHERTVAANRYPSPVRPRLCDRVDRWGIRSWAALERGFPEWVALLRDAWSADIGGRRS